MVNPPNAPSPPTQPEAPPTACGTAWGTSLNTAALLTPMPTAIRISAASDSPNWCERVISSAPAPVDRQGQQQGRVAAQAVGDAAARHPAQGSQDRVERGQRPRP